MEKRIAGRAVRGAVQGHVGRLPQAVRNGKAVALSPKTASSFKAAANHFERVLNPDRLGKLTAAALSRFQAKLREEGMKESTIGSTFGTCERRYRGANPWACCPTFRRCSFPEPAGQKQER